MNIVLEHRDGAMVVRIAGKATVHSADEMKAALIEALSATGEVMLELSGVTEVDAAFIQLLCAAQKSAAAANKVFHLGGGVPERVTRTFAEAGFPFALLIKTSEVLETSEVTGNYIRTRR